MTMGGLSHTTNASRGPDGGTGAARSRPRASARESPARSEEHTSELQSRLHLVCRLLLEKKKNKDGAGLDAQDVATVSDVRGTRVATVHVDDHVHIHDPGNQLREDMTTRALAPAV